MSHGSVLSNQEDSLHSFFFQFRVRYSALREMQWIEAYAACIGSCYYIHAIVANVMVMDPAEPYRLGRQKATTYYGRIIGQECLLC